MAATFLEGCSAGGTVNKLTHISISIAVFSSAESPANSMSSPAHEVVDISGIIGCGMAVCVLRYALCDFARWAFAFRAFAFALRLDCVL